MAELRWVGLVAWASMLGVALPLAAQPVPTPPQPSPNQPAPGASQPAMPAEPRTPAPTPPIIPRRAPIPAPGQAVPQAGPQVSPQAQPTSPDIPAPQAAPAEPQRRIGGVPAMRPGGMVSLNFSRADLVEVIHIIAQQLRLNYTIDPEVKGTVTINSAEPLRAEDLLPVFHQLLRMNDAVAVRTGNLYHIMPIKDGKGLARPAGQSKEDSFALQVIPVRFFSVAEMKRVLTPFLQPGGEIVENPRGNFLLVMDLPSNIQRLIEIVDLIDVQVFAGTRMEIYQPKVATAEELAQEMAKIMQSFASSAPQAETFAAQFIALPRINRLLVISHSEAAWTYAKRWLDRIDVVAEGPGRRIFIYPVENGKATELADVLSQALGYPSTGRRDTTRTLQDLHRSTPAGTTGLSSGSGRSSTGSSTFGSSGSFGQQSQPLGAYAAIPAPPGQVPSPVLPPSPVPQGLAGAPRPPAPGAQQQQQQQQDQLRIVPDPATNSLIIYGTVQEFQNIKNILKELDAIPRQVLIEAMVLQVDLNDTESFGVDYEILRRSRVTIFGETFNSRGALRTLGESFPLAPTFGGGSGLTGIVGGRDVQAIINALMTDSRVKLISSPSVLAADNRPARIQVGTEEPIPTGTVTAAVGASSPSSSTTIQYRNTGRILTIIPQVNSKGLVNLQIKAEVSARGEDVPFGSGETFPSFNTQDAETTAVVHDGETLVIGGLIGERKSKTRSGIPYLMDIPVVGRFFGTTGDESRRTELIMLITPRVIRNQSESTQVTEDFKSKVGAVRNELERIERDRAKSKLKPPPASGAPGIEPAPSSEKSPSGSVTPRTGASLAPAGSSGAATISTVSADQKTRNTRFTSEESKPVLQNADNTTVGAPRRIRPAEASSLESSPEEPRYVLSLARESVKAGSSQERDNVGGQKRNKPGRQWTVQVASLADKKDAETIASGLRTNGYEVFIATFESENKTWHRVRVGQLSDLEAANRLRQSLIDQGSFKQAYVVAY